jgi:uncharacterized protein
MDLQNKYILLQKILKSYGKVVIAYSGGVDSTFLLKAAVDTLNKENVQAVIATGTSLPDFQYKQAIETAKKIGVEAKTIETAEMDDPKFTANNPDRCFQCKKHLMGDLADIAKQNGFKNVLCGANADDKNDYRPGQRAVEMYGVHCPLSDANMTKEDIRQLSRQLGLPTAEQPASPCLASRISYGLEISEQRLKQVEEGEEFLRTLGLVEFRLRHHDTIARIEVHKEDFDKITKEPARSQIVEKLKSLGFKYVTIDLQGFRSGSLNEILSKNIKSPGAEKKQ